MTEVLRLSYFAGELDRVPKTLEVTWPQLVAQLTAHVRAACAAQTCGTGEHALVVDGKHKGCRHKYVGAWSPAAYPPGVHRSKRGVASVSLLVLDLDDLTDAQLADAADKLEAYRYVAHATHGDRPGCRALRAVLAISRPVAGHEWDRFWPTAIDYLGIDKSSRKGGTGGADRQACDASRLYFLPTRPSDLDYLATDNDGIALDVDAVMALAPPEVPDEPLAPVDLADVAPVDAQRRAALLLAAAWPAPGGRHNASLALCGALASCGWPAEAIGAFVAEVTRLAGGEPELEKRLKQAESSLSRVAAGERATSWGTVASALVRPDAADEARLALGIRDRVSDLVLGALGPSDHPPAATAPTTIADAYPDLAGLDAFVASAAPPALEALGEPGTYLGELSRARSDVAAASGAATGAAEERPLFQPARDLFSATFAPTPWLVEGLISEGGTAVIGSEPKTGKSWIATSIAAAVASGTIALGRFRVPRARSVAYFYAEDMGPSIRNRLRSFAAAMGMRPEDLASNLHVQPRGRHLDITRDEDVARIVASCRLIGDVGLLVLDPLRDVHSGKENESDDMAKVFAQLRLLGTLLGCTVLVPHHAKKPSKEQSEGRPGQDLRGSSAIYGSIDSGIYLRGLAGDGSNVFTNTVTSEVKGARSAGSFELTLTIKDDANGEAIHADWTSGAGANVDEDSSVVDDVMCACLEAMLRAEVKKDPPLSNRTLRDAIKGRGEMISAAMIEAEREGLATRLLVGRKQKGWGITEAGRAFVRAAPSAPEPVAAPAGTILG